MLLDMQKPDFELSSKIKKARRVAFYAGAPIVGLISGIFIPDQLPLKIVSPGTIRTISSDQMGLQTASDWVARNVLVTTAYAEARKLKGQGTARRYIDVDGDKFFNEDIDQATQEYIIGTKLTYKFKGVNGEIPVEVVVGSSGLSRVFEIEDVDCIDGKATGTVHAETPAKETKDTTVEGECLNEKGTNLNRFTTWFEKVDPRPVATPRPVPIAPPPRPPVVPPAPPPVQPPVIPTPQIIMVQAPSPVVIPAPSPEVIRVVERRGPEWYETVGNIVIAYGVMGTILLGVAAGAIAYAYVRTQGRRIPENEPHPDGSETAYFLGRLRIEQTTEHVDTTLQAHGGPNHPAPVAPAAGAPPAAPGGHP